MAVKVEVIRPQLTEEERERRIEDVKRAVAALFIKMHQLEKAGSLPAATGGDKS